MTSRIALLLTLTLAAATAGAKTFTIENKTLQVSYDDAAQAFSVAEKASGKVFLTEGKFGGFQDRENKAAASLPEPSVEIGLAVGSVKPKFSTKVRPLEQVQVEAIKDSVFGAGHRIVVPQIGGESSLELYQALPFLLVRGAVRGFEQATTPGDIDVTNFVPATFTLNLDKPASELKTLGTGGLLAPDKNPGSYLFLTCADPATRRGVVAGWLTQDRGSGVFFSDVKDSKVNFRAQIDYGRLRIPAGKSAALETLAIGCFDDARLGEEQYADAIRRQYHIQLRPPSAVYCSWYAEKHGMAGDEKSTVELAKFAAKELKPFGFGVVQIDDEWQDGPKPNGPRRGFDRARPDGPYRNGIAPVAAAVDQEGLTFGLWWLPFARNFQDPEYKDRQDWFVKRDNGKPYDTAWGGTCLDLTRPDVQAQLAHIAKLYRSWGVKYYKMDGLWTGAACEQIYVNDGYKEDHFGNNQPFHDPLISNIEAYRNGLKLLRKNAGDDVFFSGCCISQNMRELAAVGLVDSMRIGPDYNADGNGMKTGPIRGSRLYFLNGRVWWNDPDPAKVRASGATSSADNAATGAVTLEGARLGASWVAIAGQFFLISDWLPDLPSDRLDILKRTMLTHQAAARPVDYFDSSLPTTWLVTTTNGTVRRDVIGLFNQEATELKVQETCARLGLDPAQPYFAFDFWGNAPVPTFSGAFQTTVPPRSCRVIAVRPASDHPVLVSTSRHVTQGIVDVSGEKWNRSRRTLSGISAVVGKDPYELRIAGLNGGGRKWKLAAATISPKDMAAGISIAATPVAAGEDGWQRIVLNAPQSGAVQWTLTFAPD
jgi:hypothetical protein